MGFIHVFSTVISIRFLFLLIVSCSSLSMPDFSLSIRSCPFIVQQWCRCLGLCLLGCCLSWWWFETPRSESCFVTTQHWTSLCRSARVRFVLCFPTCCASRWLFSLQFHFCFLLTAAFCLCSVMLPLWLFIQLSEQLAILWRWMMHRLKSFFRRECCLIFGACSHIRAPSSWRSVSSEREWERVNFISFQAIWGLRVASTSFFPFSVSGNLLDYIERHCRYRRSNWSMSSSWSLSSPHWFIESRSIWSEKTSSMGRGKCVTRITRWPHSVCGCDLSLSADDFMVFVSLLCLF